PPAFALHRQEEPSAVAADGIRRARKNRSLKQRVRETQLGRLFAERYRNRHDPAPLLDVENLLPIGSPPRREAGSGAGQPPLAAVRVWKRAHVNRAAAGLVGGIDHPAFIG